jgi:hypothetical protein
VHVGCIHPRERRQLEALTTASVPATVQGMNDNPTVAELFESLGYGKPGTDIDNAVRWLQVETYLLRKRTESLEQALDSVLECKWDANKDEGSDMDQALDQAAKIRNEGA